MQAGNTEGSPTQDEEVQVTPNNAAPIYAASSEAPRSLNIDPRVFSQRTMSFWAEHSWAVDLPPDERRALTDRAISDADTMRGVSEMASTQNAKRGMGTTKVGRTERFLRLQAIALAPDRHDEVQIRNALEAAELLNSSIGLRSNRNIHEVSNVTYLHDVLAYNVFAAARKADTDNGRSMAKAMLGELVTDSVQEIVAISKVAERQAHRDGIDLADINGKLAEFMYVTWERLHLYMNEDPAQIGQVFIRSASPIEDVYNSDRTTSRDAVIMTFDDKGLPKEDWKPNKPFAQYKTGESRHAYQSDVKVVHINNWKHVLEHIEKVAEHFDIVVKTRDASERAASLAELDTYFIAAQLKSLNKVQAHQGRQQDRRNRWRAVG